MQVGKRQVTRKELPRCFDQQPGAVARAPVRGSGATVHHRGGGSERELYEFV